MEIIVEENETTPTILNTTTTRKETKTCNSNTPFLTFRDVSEKVLENGRLRDAIILTVIFRLIDLLFLLNTVVLWIKYYDNHKTSYYLLTLLLYLIPAVLLPLISVGRVIFNLLKSRNGDFNSPEWPPFLIEMALYMIFGPHMGAFTKWRSVSKLHSRNIKAQQRNFIIRLADEVTNYYIITNFLQTTTQFFLQFYIFSQNEGENFYDVNQIGKLQKCQLVWAVLSLACTMTAWEESLIRINWKVITITFFWKLFSLSSRMISLSLCLVTSLPLFIGICAGHWLFFTTLILIKVDYVLSKKVFLGPCLALVYIINDLNLSYKEHFPHRLIFYTISFAEGIAMMTVWIVYSVNAVWHYYWVSVLVYVAFFLGIVFLRFKHECDYSKVCPKSRQTTIRLKFYVFNSCLGYPEYDNALKYVEMENEGRN